MVTMSSFWFLLFLRLSLATKLSVLPPTGRWNYLGPAGTVSFTLLPTDRLVLLEVEARSASVSRFVLKAESGPIPSVIKFHENEENDESPAFPLAATILRPILDSSFSVDIDDQLAPIFVRVTEVKSTFPDDGWSKRVRNIILVRTKVPHFLQKSVCSFYGAQPASVRCRNYNQVTHFLRQATKPGASISIGRFEKLSSRDDKIIQMDVSDDGRNVDVRAYKSRGPVTKRKMILCEMLPDSESLRTPAESMDSDCPKVIFDGIDESILHV